MEPRPELQGNMADGPESPDNNVRGFRCMDCGVEQQRDYAGMQCPSCRGNLDVLYDYRLIGRFLSEAVLADSRDFSMWRYRLLLPVQQDTQPPSIPVGWTPLHSCPRLAAELGVGSLLLKDDGRNPTASFKDRPSALAVVKAREAGAHVITTASSGNAGVALAGMSAAAGMRSVIFVPAAAPPAKIAQLQIYGAVVVLVEGTYDEAFDLCLGAAARYGWYQRSTGVNPFMTEGKKTAALEIAEQLDWSVPDAVVVGVGDGCIIGGLWKGFHDLVQLGFIDRIPKLIGVQAEGSAAIVDALNSGGCVRPIAAATIADSICVGKPRDAAKALRAIRQSGGMGVKVPDRALTAAIGRLAKSTGVFAEPAAAAPLAGLELLQENGTFGPEDNVLLVVTGHGLKDIQAASSIGRPPLRIPPDASELDRALRHSQLLD
jgi:threonine synthase